MTNLMEGVTAAVLAGGQSQRMGQDKSGLVRPDGRTQLVFTLECLERAGIRRTLLSGVSHDHYQRIDDIHKGIGPLGGLHALLHTITSDKTAGANALSTDALIVVPCDMPYLSEDVFHHLENTSKQTGKSTAYTGSFFPFIIRDVSAAIRSLNSILNSDRKNSIKHFLLSLESDFIDPKNTENLKSCNTPEDWSEFLDSRKN
ncbi:MAG: molybdenum cofactor guanylyltransferase [Pseudomonadota bacterium]|nr:molybdenum cofactor guanylyltransferase [Pseudomonadota bacterium]MEC8522829.1 molybdenum cofactor guanylyltransferase [Pseudomonadota bacterium]